MMPQQRSRHLERPRYAQNHGAIIGMTEVPLFWYCSWIQTRKLGIGIAMATVLTKDLRISDEEFRALQAGDRTVFRRVYDAYYGLAYFICRRCGLQPQNIDEIVQDTFLKLFTRAHELKSSGQLKAWIAATCRNASIDYIRRNRRLTHGDDAVASAAAEIPDPSQSSAARELELQLVGAFIDEIVTEPGGETFVMFYRDGKTAKEIAAARDESISTVTTRLTRLRRKFAEVLKKRIETLRSNSLERGS